MKQSDNPEAFFEKYGFKLTIEEPHPIYKDTMYFEGLEADYVSSLEHEITGLKGLVQDLQRRNENHAYREVLHIQNENKRLKVELEEKPK